MSELITWAGTNAVTWGDGEGHTLDSWGSPIRTVDAGAPVSTLGVEFKNSPISAWKTQPSLRKVVGFAARNVASVPLHVYLRVADNERTRDATGQAETLLKAPSRFVTGPKLMHDLVVDWMLYDRWLVVLIDGQLRRIPARLIDVKEDFLGGVTALRVRTPKGPVDVTDSVAAYDAGWGDDTASGISPMRTLSETLEEQRRAVRWRAEQWDQQARITGILSADKRLNDQVYDRLVNTWQAYRTSKAGGTPILEDGVKFNNVDQSRPIDTQDLEGRRLTDAEVASFYHIPPELVGARQGTFSNIAAFRQMLFGPTLGPILTRFETAFNAGIIPYLAPAGAYAEFNREAALAGSFAEQASYLQKAVGGPYMSRAEARAIQNLPKLEGTDELIVPLNVSEGGLASPADTNPNDAPEWGG